MITLDIQQGTIEWVKVRLGLPTCSNFDKIITPKTGKKSGQFASYAHELLAEEITGFPSHQESSGFMQRGTALESQAVKYYELQKDCEADAVGFVLRNDRRCGGSPDRLVGNSGGLEIKCPEAGTHVSYMLDVEGIGYRAQVQGLLWVCEREWWDTLSYHPNMPAALVRQYRDEEFIKAMAELVAQFCEYKDELKERLQKSHGLFEGEQIGRPLLRVA